MNALTRDLEGLTKSAEACADGKDRFRRQDGSMIPTDCVSSKEFTTHFFNIRHLMQRVV